MGNDISSLRIGNKEYDIQDSDGYVASIRDENYHDTAHRRTTAAVSFSNDGGLHYFLATPTMTGDHPGDNGGIVHMEWDSGNNAGQLFVPNDPAGTVQWRCRKNGTWQAWKALIDDSMIEGIVTDTAKPLLPAWMSVEKDTGYPVWGHKVVVHVEEAGQLAPTIADMLSVDGDLYGETKRGFLDELETVELKTMNLGQWETYDGFVDGLDDLFGQNGSGNAYMHKLLETMKSPGRTAAWSTSARQGRRWRMCTTWPREATRTRCSAHITFLRAKPRSMTTMYGWKSCTTKRTTTSTC